MAIIDDQLGRDDGVADVSEAIRVDQRLFQTMWRPLLTLATGLTGSRVAGEDLVQDVFADVTNLRLEFPSEAAANTYLRKAVANRARSAYRRDRTRRGYEMTLPAGEPSTPAAVESLAAHAEVLDALCALRWQHRAVLVLRYWCDLPDTEIATCLSLSRANVRAIAQRAQRRLAERLDGEKS